MSYVNLTNISLQEIPKICDPEGRGNLSVIEKDVLPFMMCPVIVVEEGMLIKSYSNS